MEEQFHINKQEMGGVSVRDFLHKYIKFIPLFVLCLFISLMAAFIYLRYTTRFYNSTGVMSIETEGAGGKGKMADLFSSNGDQNIEVEMEVLHSRPLIERVVRNLGLQFGYASIGKIRSIDLYNTGPIIVQSYTLRNDSIPFSHTVSITNNQQFTIDKEATVHTMGVPFTTPYGRFTLARNNRTLLPEGSKFVFNHTPVDDVTSFIKQNIGVQPKKEGSSVLLVNMKSTNPQLSADVANGLMQQYNLLTIEKNSYINKQTLQFIDTSLSRVWTELTAAQQAQRHFQEDNGIVDYKTQNDKTFLKIQEYELQLKEQEIQAAQVKLISDYLSDKRFQNSKVPSSFNLANPTLNALIEKYNSAQIELRTILENKTSPNHPIAKASAAYVEEVKGDLKISVNSLGKSYDGTISNLKNSINAERALATNVPKNFIKLGNLVQDVETKAELFKILQAKKLEADIANAAPVSNSRIIEAARVNQTPVAPNKRNTWVMAILAGLAVPIIFVFVSELLNDKVNSRNDIERVTKATILGEVGHSTSGETLIVNKNARSMVAEQFRTIRSNLQYIIGKSPKTTIMVTSSFGGEGKSFVSTNVACSLALTGRKTVIVEFDIRKPRVLAGLNIRNRKGAVNYIVGDAPLDELIIPVPGVENLYVLPCGPIPPNPAELLLDDRVENMFTQLKNTFDVVIIDTAPVGMVSDALTLGKLADCTLYIVRQGHTYKRQIIMLDDLYKNKKLPKLSIIINDIKNRAGFGYYGHGTYGSTEGKNGGSYFVDDKEPSRVKKFISWLNPLNWFKH